MFSNSANVKSRMSDLTRPQTGRCVAAVAGRRPDPSDAQEIVFPPESISRVRTEIRALYIERRVGMVVSSAAAGADLLALDVAGSLGLRRVIVLPFAIEEFLRTSVADRPGDWVNLFKQAVSDLAPRGDVRVIGGSSGQAGAAYLAATLEIIRLAARAARAEHSSPPIGVVIWDGVTRNRGDLTAEFRSLAVEHRFAIVDVMTKVEHDH